MPMPLSDREIKGLRKIADKLAGLIITEVVIANSKTFQYFQYRVEISARCPGEGGVEFESVAVSSDPQNFKHLP